MSQIGTVFDRTQNEFSATVVNAFYSPDTNTINFPAGMLPIIYNYPFNAPQESSNLPCLAPASQQFCSMLGWGTLLVMKLLMDSIIMADYGMEMVTP